MARWQPVIDEITRAAIDDVIETGRIDFVDDLANIVPAVFTMAMLGLPLKDWVIYCEPAHAGVHPQHSPDYARVRELGQQMGMRMFQSIQEIKADPRPGLVNAVITADLGDGRTPDDMEIVGVVMLLVGGGFDTTTALTAHSLEWLSEHPDQRERLVREWDELRDSATEEFLRFYTPAQGDGRTVSQDVEIHGAELKEGDRLWLSWAMANRDETVFEEHTVNLDRTGNRHSSFGWHPPLHRLERRPGGVQDDAHGGAGPHAGLRLRPRGTVHYETTRVIKGMQHLPATFTPSKPLGPGLDETLEKLQQICDEQELGPADHRTQGRRGNRLNHQPSPWPRWFDAARYGDWRDAREVIEGVAAARPARGRRDCDPPARPRR